MHFALKKVLSSKSSESWRLTVLQSFAPTCRNTPVWKFVVCLGRPFISWFRCV